ncbi:unnamed protein product [Pedinophyceae sp. YPF-701]|nr:unnamed protein product [Pedinophyceae sp. YPF-701]
MQSPEPLLDVVRGLSTVASFSIVFTQVADLWKNLFEDDCWKCRGTGQVVCPKCRGTKDARTKPMMFKKEQVDGEVLLRLQDKPEYHYPCSHCGPSAPQDWKLECLDDDEDAATRIMNNLRKAMANRRVQPFEPTAGCVQCPACGGNPVIHRHTPNLTKVLGFEKPFWMTTQVKAGRVVLPNDFDKIGRYHMKEYPNTKDPVVKGQEKSDAAESKSVVAMSSRDAYRPEDFVYPWIDDDDTDEDE